MYFISLAGSVFGICDSYSAWSHKLQDRVLNMDLVCVCACVGMHVCFCVLNSCKKKVYSLQHILKGSAF